MRFGVVFPHHDFGTDAAAIVAFAQGVEGLGFDHLVAYDHVLGAPHDDREPALVGPYDDRHEFHEVFVLFGHLAAVTEGLELVAGVLVAPQRQTALVAKQAAQVQILSGGRLRLGLGTGWNWVEYDSLGANFAQRGAVLDEQVDVLRRLWTEPLVSVDGQFHHIDRAGISPRPPTPVPIWFGGYSPPALRRTAASGAGHLFGHLRPEILDAAAELRRLGAGAGRTDGEVGIEAITDVTDVTDVAGDADDWADTARRWQAAGGTHLTIRTASAVGLADSGCRTVDEHLAAFERWRNALHEAGVWTRPV